MSPTTVVLITLGINMLCIVVGFFASYLTLQTRWFDKNRIQADKKVSMQVFYQRLPLIGLNIVLLQVLTGFGIFSAVEAAFFDFSFSWAYLFLQFALFLIFDDFFFYWYHRLMHENDYIFKKIHRIHHRATSPFPLEFLYVHPLEWMTGTVGILIGFIAMYFMFGGINIYAFWAYTFYRSAHEIEIHSGIDGFTRLIPFYGSSRQHDDHHAYIKGNYASSLSYLDRIFGTSVGGKDAPKH